MRNDSTYNCLIYKYLTHSVVAILHVNLCARIGVAGICNMLFKQSANRYLDDDELISAINFGNCAISRVRCSGTVIKK